MATPKGFARAIIVITTVTAAVMELIDTSIVNVALSDMSGSLGVNIEDISWVITAYAIANVIIIPLTGFLAEYFGRKNYYIVSMIIFTIASYMCGQSTSLVEIIIWRFIQGVGGGALLSTSQGILFDAFEIKDRPIAAGLFGMGIVLGPTLGPTLGGYIIDHASWPLIFMINIPIGILATFLAYTFIDKKAGEGERKKEIKIDYTGILLLTVGIGCLQYVLERGESEDWFSSRIIQITGLLAVAGLIGFIWYELSIKNPAVNLKVLGNRNLAFTTIFTFVVGFGLFTSVFVFPVLAQRTLGFTAYETGLTLLAPTLIMVQLPLINQAVAGLQPKDYPSGIALNNMIRQLGGAFGIAIANNYIAHQYAQHRYDLVTKVTGESQMFQERSNIITQGIIARSGDVAGASTKALATINGLVDRQAYYLSCLDTFRLITIFFILVIPLVAFLRVKKKSKAEVAATMKAAADAH